MSDIESPVSLAATLTKMFPAFANELEGEEITSYHQVIQRLAPMVSGYLQSAPKKTVQRFCEVVNEMVAAGGERENAVSTCLLEHASQVKVRKIISSHLSAAAKQQLR